MAKSGRKESGITMRLGNIGSRGPGARGRGLPLIALGFTVAAVACAQEPPVVFRSNVNLVRVVTTVKDKAGQLVGSLQKVDFEIYDNGVKQELGVFERQTEQPLSIALMVDTSASTGIDLKYETDSAGRFLRALLSEGNPSDAVALYEINADVWLQHAFTHNYASLQQQFKLFRPQGATALYDAVYLASEALEDREGRKVIVIVTDGGDTYSKTTFDAALRADQMADAVIYPLVVTPITNDAGRNIGGEHALITMAQRTGGRAFMPAPGAELDKAFSDIISELRTQYLLAFYPRAVPPTKEPFHHLEVRVTRPELQVSARNGYYGEVEGATGTADARISVAPDKPRAVPPKNSGKKRQER